MEGGKHRVLYYPLAFSRGLPLELCLKMTGIDYELDVMSFEKWPTTKSNPKKAPFSILPVLTLPDGQMLSQTAAILYYIAQKGVMMYDDPLLDARVFELVFAADDIITLFAMTARGDKEPTKKLRDEIFTRAIPQHLERIDDSIARTSGGYAVGNRITFADCFLIYVKYFLLMPRWTHVPKDLFTPYTVINTVIDKTMENPKVNEHITTCLAAQ
eukprot:Lankesteria_metandrocarpae@DN36_c0_g1_i1.p1